MKFRCVSLNRRPMQIATSGSLLVQVSCPMEDKGSAGKVDICLLSDKPPASECGPFCSLSCCLKQREFSDERMERNTGQLGCGEKRAAPNFTRAKFIFIFFGVCAVARLFHHSACCSAFVLLPPFLLARTRGHSSTLSLSFASSTLSPRALNHPLLPFLGASAQSNSNSLTLSVSWSASPLHIAFSLGALPTSLPQPAPIR